jgi:hypothetical protein
MKQLNKIKCGVITFFGGIVTFLLLGIYLITSSPFLAFNAAKETYKNN